MSVGPGRPRKYGRPARAVTVTLPEDTLRRLSAVHADIGSAIVHVVERETPARAPAIRSAELAQYGNHAVIVVTPIRALRCLRGVQLVPVGAGRALISLDDPVSIPNLELQLRDLIEQGDVTGHEREAMKTIADILRRARAARGLTLTARTIIVLALKSRRRRG